MTYHFSYLPIPETVCGSIKKDAYPEIANSRRGAILPSKLHEENAISSEK